MCKVGTVPDSQIDVARKASIIEISRLVEVVVIEGEVVVINGGVRCDRGWRS